MFLLYKPVLYLHILAGFIYMLSHGASAAAAFRLRHEQNLDRIRAMLDLSQSFLGVGLISLLVMFLAGILLGFLGRWWAAGWIWLSLGLLVLTAVAMGLLASRHFHQVRRAVGLPYLDGNKEHPPIEPASPEEIQALLRSGKPHLITTIGVGGWAVILWLMVFKPF